MHTSGNLVLTGADKKVRRQELLLEQVLKTGYLSVEEISRRFGVTPQTARRDLADLLSTGRVRRCHGGMTPAAPIDATTRRIRRSQNTKAKRRIADCVAKLIPDGASIYLDAGSTMETIAGIVAQRRRDLDVTTTSVRIAAELSERDDFTVHIPTGIVRGGDNAVIGEDVAPWLRSRRFDVLVMTVGGISESGHVTVDTAIEVPILRAAIDVSDRVIVAADSTKFDFRAPELLMGIERINALVTDAQLPRALLARLTAENVELHLL